MANVLKNATFFCFSLLASAAHAIGDPRLPADVVGRDMADPILGPLGHIGIYTGSGILEVLKSSSVIEVNSLANFKSRSKYWGARYGYGYPQASSIISAGLSQRSYSPSYTLSPFWVEGKVIYKCTQYNKYGQCVRQTSSVQRASFRCDTFVNYAFWKGMNRNLTNAGPVINPWLVFLNQPYVR